MDAKTILTGLGLILGLFGTLGIAYAVFRSATVTKTVELYKGENEVLGKAVARQQGDIIALQERTKALEEENRVLKNLATGSSAIETLTGLLRQYEGERKSEHSVITETLAEMKETLSELWRSVVRLLGDRR